MNQLFSISGYWKDDKSEFSDYIVSSSDDIGEDDDIFFYGLSESELSEAVTLGENTAHEFVITHYEPIN